MESMLIGANTHPGQRRKENQDAFIDRQLWSDDKALLAVIDGVGGYTGGEKAAAIARDCIAQYMLSPSGDILTMLREALIFANNRIVEERKKDQRTSEMCCVLTAVVADSVAQCIYYAHVGDTRLYRFRDGKLQKLTRDHSFVGIREDAGEMSEAEAMSHPHRNQILREVGSALHRLDDEDFMDYGKESLMPGDLLLLCSDGLTDMVTSFQIVNLLSTGQSLINKINSLIELANNMGGHDNITVVLLQSPFAANSLQNTTGIPVIEKKPEVVSRKTGISNKRQPGKTTLLWALLLLLLVAGAGWYLAPAKELVVSATNDNVYIHSKDSIASDSNTIKTTSRVNHPAVPGPAIKEKTDTLRISGTQSFSDIKHFIDSTGRLLVLVPAKNSPKRFTAMSITRHSAQPGDTLLVRNMRVSGFETGIDIQIPVILKTENLVFENTSYPFRYLFKPGEKQPSILFMNTVKQ